MTIHTFPVSSQSEAVSEITTCTMTLLDNTVCTSEADRQINGDKRECYKCGETVCKRHHSVLVLQNKNFHASTIIEKYGVLSICTTCDIGDELAASAKNLANTAEASYKGRVSCSLNALEYLVDELAAIADKMRRATTQQLHP